MSENDLMPWVMAVINKKYLRHLLREGKRVFDVSVLSDLKPHCPKAVLIFLNICLDAIEASGFDCSLTYKVSTPR
jgi:hypothetical protein